MEDNFHNLKELYEFVEKVNEKIIHKIQIVLKLNMKANK